MPLIFVLTLTAFKDAIDDIVSLFGFLVVNIKHYCLLLTQQKHRSDSQVNNRLSRVLRNGKLVDERWYKVEVGDVVKIENDNFVAVSCFVL